MVVDRPAGPSDANLHGFVHTRLGRFALGVFVGGCVAGAVAVRLYFAVGPHSSPSSDEAIVGLMAVRLLRHGILPSAFYWNQPYGGSLESLAVVPFIFVFGTSTLGLRAATIVFELTTTWLVWRVARHLFNPMIAACVGLVALFLPLAVVRSGTEEYGFYSLTAALGVAAVLMAVNVHERPTCRRCWFGLGLAVGVGWWMSPNIVYYAVPVTAWLVMQGHWRQTRNMFVAMAACVAGSTVWIVANIRSGLASLLQPPHIGGSSTFATRFVFFWTHGLPFALGLRAPWAGHWYGPAGIAVSVYVGMLIAFAFALRSTKVRDAPDVFLLALSPVVFAAFIGNWSLGNGRYGYFVASMMPFAVGRVIGLRSGRVVVAVLLAVSTFGFVNAYGDLINGVSGSAAPLARTLAARGYHTAVGDYWIAYKMTYESDELVIASPLPGMVGVRYPPYEYDVYHSRPAYLFGAADTKDILRLARVLQALHISFGLVTREPYVAILPHTRYVPTSGPPY